mgnify:CR=1 FL=1
MIRTLMIGEELIGTGKDLNQMKKMKKRMTRRVTMMMMI